LQLEASRGPCAFLKKIQDFTAILKFLIDTTSAGDFEAPKKIDTIGDSNIEMIIAKQKRNWREWITFNEKETNSINRPEKNKIEEFLKN